MSGPSIASRIQQGLSAPEAMWIVVSNAIPIVGVLAFDWPAFSLLLFYWIENVVIGGFNALKIAVAGLTKPAAMAAFTLFLVPFFAFHYGMFCYVHGIFVVAMFNFAGGASAASGGVPDMFDLAPYVWRYVEADADLRLGVMMLIAVQAGWFLAVWVLAGKWRDTNPLAQMFEPYSRIVVLHLAIFIATIPVLLLGQTWLAVLALAAMKCAMELGLPQFSVGDKFKNLPPDRFPDRLD